MPVTTCFALLCCAFGFVGGHDVDNCGLEMVDAMEPPVALRCGITFLEAIFHVAKLGKCGSNKRTWSFWELDMIWYDQTDSDPPFLGFNDLEPHQYHELWWNLVPHLDSTLRTRIIPIIHAVAIEQDWLGQTYSTKSSKQQHVDWFMMIAGFYYPICWGNSVYGFDISQLNPLETCKTIQ